MKFSRYFSAILVLSVFIFSGNILAVTNPAESLARLSEDASKQSIVLDETSKNKVQNSCQTAQNNLKSLRQKEQRIQRERTETYLDVQNEIDALRLRLMRQGVEVTGVAKALLNYREQTDQYDRLSKSYYEALNDTVVIDCRQSPEAFVAGLNVIRQKRALLFENTSVLQTDNFGSIKEQFNLIKNEVKV